MEKGTQHNKEPIIKMRASCLNHSRSLESRLKQSKSVSGKNNHFYDKKHSEETLQIMSNIHKNISQKTRNKMSASHKGKVPWNKGKKGIYSEEYRKKISESKQGKKHSEKTKQKMSVVRRGKPKSEEHKRKIGNALKERVFTESTIEKMSIAKKGKCLPEVTKKKMQDAKSGANHPNWRGGISFLPYCHKFNNRLRELIRQRDNYQCQNPRCKLTQQESFSRHNLSLSVHHIHYDKSNCYPDLITLCNSCNLKANNNRNFYESFYMNILNENKLLFWGRNNTKDVDK